MEEKRKGIEIHGKIWYNKKYYAQRRALIEKAKR